MRLLIILIVSAVSAYAAEPELTVIATGHAAIENENVDAARETARQSALRTAIEESIGYYITARTQVENFSLVHSRVVSEAGGLAAIRRVVAEGRQGNQYRTTLEVAVSPVPLMRIIRQNGLLRQWRVMVVIPEVHLRSPAPDPAGETEIIRQFSEAGFKTVDPAAYARLRDAGSELFKSAAARRKIAKTIGADIMILGEAFSERAQDASGGMAQGLVGCNARIEAKAIATDTGEIFYADGVNSLVPALHTSEIVAGKKAIQSVAAELAQKFLQKLVARLAALSRPTTIIVHGVATLAQAKATEQAIGKLRGVGRMRREEFTGDTLVLEADMNGADSESIAERIGALTVQGAGLQFLASSRHLLRFQLRTN